MASHQIDSFDADTATATLSLDAGLYPLDVVYGAAYALIDRAYVLLDKTNDGDRGSRIVVHLRGKRPLDRSALEAISGEFGNELLSQALRRKIVKANGHIIEEIVTTAIAGAAGAALPQDFLAQEDEDDLDFLDDPLGIAVPWEEKFKKGE
jgi:His-Xaa-Ser system protein HxsD